MSISEYIKEANQETLVIIIIDKIVSDTRKAGKVVGIGSGVRRADGLHLYV